MVCRELEFYQQGGRSMLVIKNNMDYQQLGPSVGYAVPQERSDVYMMTRSDVPQPSLRGASLQL